MSADPAKLAKNEVVMLHALLGRCETCIGEECEVCQGEGATDCECDSCGDEHEADCYDCKGTGYKKPPENRSGERCERCKESIRRIVALRNYYPGCDPHQGTMWSKF